MWIARDKDDGSLFLYDNMPKKFKEYWDVQRGYNAIELDSSLFPKITWENSPKKIELVEEDLVEKACKWLNDNLYTTHDTFHITSIDSIEYNTVERLIEGFRKAMKN